MEVTALGYIARKEEKNHWERHGKYNAYRNEI